MCIDLHSLDNVVNSSVTRSVVLGSNALVRVTRLVWREYALCLERFSRALNGTIRELGRRRLSNGPPRVSRLKKVMVLRRAISIATERLQMILNRTHCFASFLSLAHSNASETVPGLRTTIGGGKIDL